MYRKQRWQFLLVLLIGDNKKKASMKLNQYQTKEGGTRKCVSLNERLWLGTNQDRQKKPKGNQTMTRMKEVQNLGRVGGSLNNCPTQAIPRTSADKDLAAASKHFSAVPKYPGVKDPGKTFRQRKASLSPIGKYLKVQMKRQWLKRGRA